MVVDGQVVEIDMFFIQTLQVFLNLILNFKQERKGYNPAKPPNSNMAGVAVNLETDYSAVSNDPLQARTY